MTTRQNKSANTLITEQAYDQAIAKVITMEKGYVDKWHNHPWHQIIFPFEGILQTKVADTQFIVPHSGMLFIPAHTDHESFVMTDTQFIGIYLNPNINVHFPGQTKAISVTPFLRELLLQVKHSVTDSQTSSAVIAALLKVLSDQLCDGESYDMALLLPSDRRLLTIFNAFIDNPQLNTKLSTWAEQVGASERTLSRLFTKELGMSFPLWRQHLRLVSSLNLLETKLSVQEISFRVGYNADSSYIYAFKKLFKQTPQQYRHNSFHLSTRIQRSLIR
jgi:AraC-like DNA-binding protein/quercetin dioxygenase-like cupin family protein